MRGDGPPFVKLGRSVRYDEGTLVQWMKSRLRLSTSEP
jgi:predicted DNA-binding transcriptional regulator AlpA